MFHVFKDAFANSGGMNHHLKTGRAGRAFWLPPYLGRVLISPSFLASILPELIAGPGWKWCSTQPGGARKQHFRRILLLMQVDGAPSGRLAPLLWMLFGGVLAFLPAALAIPFGPVYLGAAAGIGLWFAGTLKRFPQHRLTPGEWLLEGVRMSFEPSIAAFLLMAAEGIARGVALLARYAGIPVPAFLPRSIALTLFVLVWLLIGSVWKNSVVERLGIRSNGPPRYLGWEAAGPSDRLSFAALASFSPYSCTSIHTLRPGCWPP